MEWQDEYNSFNSNKGLMYKQWYDAIVAGKFLPPIECSVDPVNDCNLKCFWCNSKEPVSRKEYMPDQHFLDLIDFFPKWGAKAICIAGGGEPTMHNSLTDAFKRSILPISIICNGLFKDDAQMQAIAQNARWVGVSVDAATPEMFKFIKQEDKFQDVICNMHEMRELGTRELTFKFLIHPKNQYQIYDACRIAKHVAKAHRIHIRPISFLNFQGKEDSYDVSAINAQVRDARIEFEDDDFKIFAITHKFDNDMHRKFNFNKCRATPIMPIFQANGDITICIDRKEDRRLVIGKHDPVSEIEKVWGSDQHKAVIDAINLNDCPKCTFTKFNEQIENAVLNDNMDWSFT